MSVKENLSLPNNKFQNILKALSQCKTNYSKDNEDCKHFKEINSKLELELKEMQELEKSRGYHLQSSREMIENLQETVSHLVYLKRDTKKLKDEISSKDSSITAMAKERDKILQRHNDDLMELKNAHEKQLEEMSLINEKKIYQAQHDADTKVAQFTCVIEELRANIKEMEAEHRDKMNVVILEYEEKLQKSTAQIIQLRDQQAGLETRTAANNEAYKRRLEEVENKLKQSQFQQYLEQSSLPSQYHAQTQRVDRPYSANRGPYEQTNLIHERPVLEAPKINYSNCNKAPNRSINPLQVTYQDSRNNVQNNEKKGPFNIVKKRKLYNEKDLPNF